MRILMRLLPFVAVLMVGVGTMLLGLNLMTLPQKPASRPASAPNKLVSAPNKLEQHEADQRAEKTEGDVSRPLAPLYPATPGGAKDVRMVYPPNTQPNNQQNKQSSVQAAATTGAAPASEQELKQKASLVGPADSNASPAEPQQAQAAEPQQAQAAEPQQARAAEPQQKTQASAPQPVQKPQAAKTEESPAQKPAQTVGMKSAPNHCDVQACANAYSSFRAADCTYQPFEGPRRACTAAPVQRSAARGHSHAIAPAYTQREVEPRTGYSANVAVDDDEDDDRARAGLMDGRRVIILDRNYRPW